MKKSTILNKKVTLFSIVLSIFILLSSVLFVGRGVWINTVAVLSSPPAIVALAKNSIVNMNEYVPLNLYSWEFTPIHIERTTREVMTGVELGEYDWRNPLSEVKNQIIYAVWASLISWAAIATALILSSKISFARKNASESALPSILGIWCCILGTMTASVITLLAFNYIDMPLMFALAGVGSIIIYKYSKAHTTPIKKSKDYPTLTNGPLEDTGIEKKQHQVVSNAQKDESTETAYFESQSVDEVVCPVCHKAQKPDRTNCYSCGCKFEYGVSQNEHKEPIINEEDEPPCNANCSLKKRGKIKLNDCIQTVILVPASLSTPLS